MREHSGSMPEGVRSCPGADRDAPAPGNLLAGRYRLQSVIAVGGMGRVWRALDIRIQRPVAVKVLRGELSGDPMFRARFRIEARHAGQLNHPNVAAVHDYGESSDPSTGEPVSYLVMEFVEGEALAQLLQRTPVLGVELTLGIVRQTAAALAAAHKAGMVHRDVKPGNLLVTPDGRVKLTDFGLAWSAASVPLTRAGHVVGTAHYLAPEQVEGNRATAASDVYSLGVVAYECLAGRLPFEGQTSVEAALMRSRATPPPLPGSVPDDVRALVQHAMARQVADRLPDGAALCAAVDALLARRSATAGVPVPGRPVAGGPNSKAAPRSRRRVPVVVWSVAAAVALVVIAIVVAGVSRSSGRDVAATAPVPPTPSGAMPAPTTSAVTPATVAVGALAGRPVAEVHAELAAAGLRVLPQATRTADVPAGHVVTVSPAGNLPPGSTVTVTYAAAPEATSGSDNATSGSDDESRSRRSDGRHEDD